MLRYNILLYVCKTSSVAAFAKSVPLSWGHVPLLLALLFSLFLLFHPRQENHTVFLTVDLMMLTLLPPQGMWLDETRLNELLT